MSLEREELKNYTVTLLMKRRQQWMRAGYESWVRMADDEIKRRKRLGTW